MITRTTNSRQYENGGLILRAILCVFGVALGFVSLPPVLLAAVCGYIGITSITGFAVTRSKETYTRVGRNFFTGLRCLDAAMIGSSSVLLTTTPIWPILLPAVLIEGLSSRNYVRILLVSAIGSLAQLAALELRHQSILSDVVVLACFAGTPVLAIVLSQYRSAEERLADSDRRLASLMGAASGVSGNQDLRGTILQALTDAVKDLRATAGYVMLTSEEDRHMLVTEAAYSSEGEYHFPESIAVGLGMSGYVVKMAQTLEVTKGDQDTLDLDGMGIPVRRALSVPLVNRSFGSPGQASKEEVLGAMTILFCDVEDKTAAFDLNHLTSIASLLAVAIANARLEERQRATFLRTLESLATALEARDEYTQGHSQRVGEVAVLIGQELGFGPEALDELRIGTTLHDIGKIGVPDAILNKPRGLTDEEFHLMKQHPVIGYDICSPLSLPEGVLMIIRNHHEKLDGSGYPDGLRGGELPLSLRVVCVADAFDAMSSRRPYRNVLKVSKVIEELSRFAGIQFDPVVIETLKKLLHAGRLDSIYEEYWDNSKEAA